MERYKTQIRNNRDQAVSLRSPKNYVGAILIVPPRSTRTIDFDEENYFLAQFEKIVFKKKGKVDTRQRKGYKVPEKKFPATTFLNSGGVDLECIVLDSSDTIQLPKGIPIHRNVPLFSYYAEFESVEISEPKTTPKAVIMNPGTFKYEKKPNFKLVKRSLADLKKLKQMREAAYLRSAGFKAEE